MALFLCLVCTQSPAESKEHRDPINISKALRKCKTCHGKNLSGKKKAPAIAGESYSVLYVSLTSSIPKKMKRVAGSLSKEEVSEISRFISEMNTVPEGDLD